MHTFLTPYQECYKNRLLICTVDWYQIIPKQPSCMLNESNNLYSVMAFWPILHFRRKLFLKRRYAFVIAVAVLPFMGYFIFFAAPSQTFPIPVVEKSISANNLDDCPCAARRAIENNIAKQTEAVIKPTARTTITGDRKVVHDTSTSTRTLNVHMWSEICGMNVDILRNWPHFPYFPDKRSFVSEFRKTQVPNVENTLRAEVPSIFLERSGRGRDLC